MSDPSRLGLGPRPLNEEDIRRIVREELKRHADQPADALPVCPLCDKGRLVVQEYSRCLNPDCKAEPIMPDQVRRNHERRTADPTSAGYAPFRSLDYIETQEDLEEYVQVRIAADKSSGNG